MLCFPNFYPLYIFTKTKANIQSGTLTIYIGKHSNFFNCYTIKTIIYFCVPRLSIHTHQVADNINKKLNYVSNQDLQPYYLMLSLDA